MTRVVNDDDRRDCHDLRLITPFALIVGGCSNSGKTFLAAKIAKYDEDIVDKKFDKVVVFYDVPGPQYEELFPNAELIHGPPSFDHIEDICENSENPYVVIDDLLDKTSPDLLSQLFSKYVHHRHLNCALLVHDLYYRGNSATRFCSLQSSYTIITSFGRDKSVLSTVGRQTFPGCSGILPEAYSDCREHFRGKELPYLLLDTHSQSKNERLKLRTRIFPDEKPAIAYIPRKI